MTLGERIKQKRLERGLSQAALAVRAHVAQPIISRLETHTRLGVHSDVLKKLALTLGCSADYLIGMYDEKETLPR
jgi:transcriptional regulator with XRE-family HTH domain